MDPINALENPLASHQLALGCMMMGGSWDASEPPSEATVLAAQKAIDAALESGIRLFDHADIYCAGKSETVFGRVLRERPELRESLVLQSKCGIRFAGQPDASSPKRYDFSAEHICRSVEGILFRLGTEYLDVVLFHRPDPLCQPEEMAEACSKLHAQGKVRHFGVSNHFALQLQWLEAHLPFPLVANQVELNLLQTQLLDAGRLVADEENNGAAAATGTLEYCQLRQIQVQAWAPLAKGIFAQPASQQSPLEAALSLALRQIAGEHSVDIEAVLVAWLRRHPAHILPVVGSLHPGRIAAAGAGAKLELSREEWYRLYTADGLRSIR